MTTASTCCPVAAHLAGAAMLTCIVAMPFENLGLAVLTRHGSSGRVPSLRALVEGDVAKPKTELGAQFLEPQS